MFHIPPKHTLSLITYTTKNKLTIFYDDAMLHAICEVHNLIEFVVIYNIHTGWVYIHR